MSEIIPTIHLNHELIHPKHIILHNYLYIFGTKKNKLFYCYIYSIQQTKNKESNEPISLTFYDKIFIPELYNSILLFIKRKNKFVKFLVLKLIENNYLKYYEYFMDSYLLQFNPKQIIFYQRLTELSYLKYLPKNKFNSKYLVQGKIKNIILGSKMIIKNSDNRHYTGEYKFYFYNIQQNQFYYPLFTDIEQNQQSIEFQETTCQRILNVKYDHSLFHCLISIKYNNQYYIIYYKSKNLFYFYDPVILDKIETLPNHYDLLHFNKMFILLKT